MCVYVFVYVFFVFGFLIGFEVVGYLLVVLLFCFGGYEWLFFIFVNFVCGRVFLLVFWFCGCKWVNLLE